MLLFIIMMIIKEICKAPTLRLKALNKHRITYILYIEMENFNPPPPPKNNNNDTDKGFLTLC